MSTASGWPSGWHAGDDRRLIRTHSSAGTAYRWTAAHTFTKHPDHYRSPSILERCFTSKAVCSVEVSARICCGALAWRATKAAGKTLVRWKKIRVPLGPWPGPCSINGPTRLLRGKRPQPPNIFLVNISALDFYVLSLADIFPNLPRAVIAQLPATTALRSVGKELS